MFPSTFSGVPHWLQPLVNSPLVLGTLVALALNFVFRLGIRRKVDDVCRSGRTGISRKSANFVERNAAIWGARRDVVARVEFAVQQAAEAIVEYCQVKGTISIEIGYDEFDIDVTLTYPGDVLELTGRLPSREEILEFGGGRAAASRIPDHAAIRPGEGNRQRPHRRAVIALSPMMSGTR